MWGTDRMLTTITIVSTLLGCCSQPCEGLRILSIFPLNSKSHFAMLGRLVQGLAAEGHQVDVYSHFPSKQPIRNYRDYSLEGSMPILSNNMTYDTAIQFQAVEVQKVMDRVGTPLCELMSLPVFRDLLKSPRGDHPYDLVIVEAFLSNCYYAWGRHLDIPMIGVMTTSLFDWYNEALGNPFNPLVTVGLGSNFFPPMNFWQRLTNTFMSTLISMKFKSAVRGDQDKYIERFFGPGYPDAVELQKDLDLLLVNMHQSLDGIRAFTPAIVPIAGMHIKDDDTKLSKEIQEWLDNSKDGCIYISFGSMIRIETFPQSILDSFYATFKNIAPVRVLMKIAKPEELPPGLPANVKTHYWLPQEQVLKHKHTKAFVTHGGLMGTQEAIYYAVPLVGIPIFGDQHINLQADVERGIATVIELENITEEKLTKAIKEVLFNPEYKKNSEKLSKLFIDRPMTPLDTAIYWIEYISRHGKKALRSPIVDLPWWQVYGLDILFVFIVIYYVLKLLLRKIYNLCCSAKQINSQLNTKSKKN